jgi:hypothetical protein
MLLAFLSVTCGLILDSVTRSRREMKRLAYLQIPAYASSSSGEEMQFVFSRNRRVPHIGSRRVLPTRRASGPAVSVCGEMLMIEERQ